LFASFDLLILNILHQTTVYFAFSCSILVSLWLKFDIVSDIFTPCRYPQFHYLYQSLKFKTYSKFQLELLVKLGLAHSRENRGWVYLRQKMRKNVCIKERRSYREG
jgi:hypothetical protein